VNRLRSLGYALPPPVEPLGEYVTGVRSGDLVFFGGHGPLRKDGKPSFSGRLGVDFDANEVAEIAIGATLNVLASAHNLVGDLESIELIKGTVFVASGDDASSSDLVCGPAVTLLGKVFGQLPVVSVVPVVSLPNNVPVLIELLFKLRGNS